MICERSAKINRPTDVPPVILTFENAFVVSQKRGMKRPAIIDYGDDYKL